MYSFYLAVKDPDQCNQLAKTMFFLVVLKSRNVENKDFKYSTHAQVQFLGNGTFDLFKAFDNIGIQPRIGRPQKKLFFSDPATKALPSL